MTLRERLWKDWAYVSMRTPQGEPTNLMDSGAFNKALDEYEQAVRAGIIAKLREADDAHIAETGYSLINLISASDVYDIIRTAKPKEEDS